MSHGTSHHLEEAEHAQHAAHDDFNRIVAMTMAIIAAVLAFVTLLSHRAHTDTLRLKSESNVAHTKATDLWSYYQSKNIRFHEYNSFLSMMAVIAKDPAGAEQRKAVEKKWKEQVAKYEKELPQMEENARAMEKKGEALALQSDAVHHQADRYDLGELGVELALVLSSIAVLTRKRSFWLGGVVFGIAGLAVALSGLFVH